MNAVFPQEHLKQICFFCLKEAEAPISTFSGMSRSQSVTFSPHPSQTDASFKQNMDEQ